MWALHTGSDPVSREARFFCSVVFVQFFLLLREMIIQLGPAASAAKGRADATRRHSLGVIAVPIAVITANTVANDTTLISHRGT